MEAINVSAEYRNTWGTGDVNAPSEQEFVSDMLSSGQWVLDDGDYYTREEWYAEAVLEAEEQEAEEYEQSILRDQAEHEEREAAEDNFRSWLDETEPEFQDRIGH